MGSTTDQGCILKKDELEAYVEARTRRATHSPAGSCLWNPTTCSRYNGRRGALFRVNEDYSVDRSVSERMSVE